jgi:trehalose/maltose transport system substrate-binding protein
MAKKFSDATGIDVQVIHGDRSATDRLATYRQQWAAGSADIDVYMIDVIWPGIAAEFAEDLNPAFPNAKSDFFPAIVENNTVGGKLVGIPWYTDAGLLYYRKDLLQKYGFSNPPATWKELEEQAKKIQDGERAAGSADFWGFVWQGKSYEGLTCDALEWQVSNGGGSIIEPDGTISINNPQAIAAFDRAKGWVGTISPPGVTGYDEETSRGVWQAGNAAFMRNWPYAYAIGQADPKLKDKFDVTPLPKGDGDKARNADTLGGWQLMVNKDSKNKEAAIEFVKYMTSTEIQKSYAIERALLPTRPALYDDADVLKTNPYYAPLKAVFSGGAVARPSTVSADLYNDVSTAYFTAVNQILTGSKDSKTAVADLETEIQKILK